GVLAQALEDRARAGGASGALAEEAEEVLAPRHAGDAVRGELAPALVGARVDALDARVLVAAEGRAREDRDLAPARHLDGLRVQDARPLARHLLHLLVLELLDALRVVDHARVRAVDAVDVAEDVAVRGVEGRREGDRARVAAAAAER